MSKEIELKIRSYCEKYNMDCSNLELISIDDGYLAKDKKIKLLFDKNGVPSSLPMNYTYGVNTTKMLGKYSSILIYASFAAALLFVLFCGLIKNI